MAELSFSKKGKQFVLLGQESQLDGLGLDLNADYEMVKAKKGIWVLIAMERPLDKKVLEILTGKDLEQRVEGKFEEFLGKEELKRFKEMLREGSIVAFRLSPKYKKAVYKTREEIEGNVKIGKPGKRQEPGKEKESSLEEYSLERDGFIVCKNVNRAKQLSERLRKEIEAGKIRGIKSFDGFFYIAKDALYQRYRAKVLSLIKSEKGIGSAKIGERIGISTALAKIACELLKDEGEIIEKRKDQFQAI